METRLPLYWRGNEWGILRCREQEVRTAFSFRCASPGPGLYKAYLVGEGGTMLLGTPMPEGNCLTLSRVLTHQALRACGVDLPMRGELTPAAAGAQAFGPKGWQPLRAGELSELEAGLRQAVQAMPQLWRRELAEGFALAVPWRPGQELPLTQLVCFSTVKKCAEGWFLVFAFHKNGMPKLLHDLEWDGVS